ncbi:14650_t:CDS:1 [Acaulospora morrowiae]|uniref:14650_t:CDS:1 n=1 Tax=Acaulospora morrowiae TaxID=94023 RepID=A0A9N8V9H1_9GLOM|nr:14650_t:CDS:1 [Acaulospora morrowiae]
MGDRSIISRAIVAVVENPIIQVNVFTRNLDVAHFANILNLENGRSSRSDLKVCAYNIFKVVVNEEAMNILNESNPNVIGYSSTKLWKRAPQHVKNEYRTCAERLEAIIPKRRFQKI